MSRFLNLKTLLFIGVILVIAFFALSRNKTVDNFVEHEIVEYNVTHPFPIQSTNLLNREEKGSSIFQSRLNKYDVRAALDSILIEQDLQTVIDTFLTLRNLTIPITAYDPKAKIGYVWMDYDRFGEGILDKKLGTTRTQEQFEQDYLKSVDDGMEQFMDDEAQFLDDQFGKVFTEDQREKAKVDEQLKKRINEEWRTAMDSMSKGLLKFEEINHKYRAYVDVNPEVFSSTARKRDIFGNIIEPNSDFVNAFGKEVRSKLQSLKSTQDKKQYLELMLKEFGKVALVNDVSSRQNKSMLDEWKLSASEMIEEPVRFFGFYSLIDQIRIHSPNNRLLTVLGDQIFQISLYKNSKEWWAHSLAILDLFNVNKNPGLYNKTSYQNLLGDIMVSSKYTKWKKRYSEIEALGDVENISLIELKSLDALAFEKGVFIAPISILDNRLIYDMEDELYQSQLDSLRTKISLSKNKADRKKLHEELLEISTFRANNYNDIRKKAKKNSLDILQNDFREYIAWAKEESKKKP